MDSAAIAYIRAMAEAAARKAAADAAAARVELPMKRAREDAACAPRKKARIASVKDATLPTTEPLGSYWTTVPDRCGGNSMISVRRSHRLRSRSWAAHVVLVQTLKWPIRCAVKHLTNNKNSPLGLFIVLSFLIVAACSYFVSCIITVSFCLRLVHSYGLGTDLKKATLVLVKTIKGSRFRLSLSLLGGRELETSVTFVIRSWSRH